MIRRVTLIMTWTVLIARGQTYSGPSMLGRGPSANFGAPSDELVVLRPSFQVLGSYETGMFLPSVDSSGRQSDAPASYGVSAVASLGGYHRWKRTILGMNYQGDFRHYTQRKQMDGIDQILSLNVQHQSSARTTFSLTGAGGTSSRGYGMAGFSGLGLNYDDYSQGYDPTLRAVNVVDLFNTRTFYAAGGADAIHQMSARLSVRAGGTAFAIRRRARGLVELNGYMARADTMYRLGRMSTIGIDYSMDSYRFVRSFGSSDIHTAALNYTVRLNRDWTLAVRGGVYRMENLRTVLVELDPAVAAILGQSSGIEASHKIYYGPVIEANLARNFRRAGLSFRYLRGTTPGNGAFMTSRREEGRAAYSYQGWRRWSLSADAAATKNVTMFQGYATYTHYTGAAHAAYRVGRNIHITSHAMLRRYVLSTADGRLRNSSLVSVGLGFAPRDLPLVFW